MTRADISALIELSATSLPSGSIEGAGELTPSVDRFYEALAAIVIPAIEAVLRD